AVAALASSSAADRQERSADGEFLQFEAGAKGLALTDLIAKAKEITGEEFFFEPDDFARARGHFVGTITIPKERFLGFCDWCLHSLDFLEIERTVSGARSHNLRKLGAQSHGGRSQTALKTNATVVDRETLDAMSDRFTLVTTRWTAKHLPPRETVS